MANLYSTDKKKEIINMIKTEGKTVQEAATLYGVSSQSIYAWMSTGATKDATALEIIRLKRQVNELTQFIGELTVTLKKKSQNRGGNPVTHSYAT